MSSTPYNDKQTSKEAARHVAKTTKTTMAQRVLNQIAKCGKVGVTDWGIEMAEMLPHTTVSPRRRQLVLEGKVVDSGRTQKLPSGRRAIVWVLAEYAQPEYTGENRPSDVDVIVSKMRTAIGKITTREQADEAWQVLKLAGVL